MIYVCELLTEEPEGGSAMIPLPTFIHLYQYLAELDCSGRYSYIEEKLEPFPCVCSDFKIPSLEPSVEVKNCRAFFLFFFSLVESVTKKKIVRVTRFDVKKRKKRGKKKISSNTSNGDLSEIIVDRRFFERFGIVRD